ncbi:MAG: transcription elongation factor GreA [Bifidobacteriaceae bacterium]|jgi:transcription elongation factor GreA|nr:transcription elongation factor GreA [Bifidobacteriaceae bacterium]
MTNKIWLSNEAYQKLKDELKYLTGEKRQNIKKRIAAARAEGDLKENGGYHAAKEEQGKNEGRIKELEYKLANAIIDAPVKTDEISAGSLISAKIDQIKKKFILGSREIKDTLKDNSIDVYSPTSPIGQTVLGAKAGDKLQYTAPNGKQIEIEILKIDII